MADREQGTEFDDEARTASEVIKRYAKENKVVLELSPEALDSLVGAWKQHDPRAPAEISFVVEGREIGNFKVAACAYAGDTCCA